MPIRLVAGLRIVDRCESRKWGAKPIGTVQGANNMLSVIRSRHVYEPITERDSVRIFSNPRPDDEAVLCAYLLKVVGYDRQR